MKYTLRGEVVVELPVFGIPTGVRCDEVVLDKHDAAKLLEAAKSTDDRARAALIDVLETMVCHFVP